MIHLKIIFISLLFVLIISENYAYPKRRDNKEKCPKVKALRNFNLSEMMGFWYVVQYYASSEDLPEYACMRSVFSNDVEDGHVTMNFTYVFSEDPTGEILQGNITWIIPSYDIPAHWIHTEDIYEGIYNTYVIDTDYKSWGLIMHCAEKTKSPRYLSALLLSREPTLGVNVVNFLREKLPKYDIDTSFMFPINQSNCDEITDGSGVLMKKSEYQIREYMEKQEKIKIFNKN